MPITGREVGPIRICQIQHLTGPLVDELSSSQVTHNLEETTYIALTGLMRQLSDIATYADEIFAGVFDVAKKTVERSERLHQRLGRLNEALQSGDSAELQQGGPEMIKKEQTLLTRNSRPRAIKDRYEASVKSPPLHDFVEYIDNEESNHPHLLYSDPSLFVNAWLTLMDKEAQQFKKQRKRSFKKARENNNKIATLKKKVHDPKSKTYVMVDVEPQYATLPLGRGAATTQPVPLSATLSRKARPTSHYQASPGVTEQCSPPDSYTSPVRQESFDNQYNSCSTPIPEDPASPARSPSDVMLTVPQSPLPPPPDDMLPPPPPDLPLPPPPCSPPAVDKTPPPFLPPPVPDEVIKPNAVSATQRILRTHEVPQTNGRDKLLDMIRSSSFSLRPVTSKPPSTKITDNEPTYATYQGTDVASILQRRKYLMGVGDQSEYSGSSDNSEDEGWD